MCNKQISLFLSIFLATISIFIFYSSISLAELNEKKQQSNTSDVTPVGEPAKNTTIDANQEQQSNTSDVTPVGEPAKNTINGITILIAIISFLGGAFSRFLGKFFYDIVIFIFVRRNFYNFIYSNHKKEVKTLMNKIRIDNIDEELVASSIEKLDNIIKNISNCSTTYSEELHKLDRRIVSTLNTEIEALSYIHRFLNDKKIQNLRKIDKIRCIINGEEITPLGYKDLGRYLQYIENSL